MMYDAKGRTQSYADIIRMWAEKAEQFDIVNEAFEEHKKESKAKGNQLRGKIKRLTNLINKLGNDQMKEELALVLVDPVEVSTPQQEE